MPKNVNSATTESMELDRIRYICGAAGLMEDAAKMLDAADAIEDNPDALERVVIDRIDLKSADTAYLECLATFTDNATHAKDAHASYLQHVAEVLSSVDAERLTSPIESVSAIAEDVADDAALYREWLKDIRAELASRAQPASE